MISEKASEKLFDSFLTNEEFSDDPLFLLSSGIVTYLKTTATFKNGEKAGAIWDNLKALADFKDLNDKNSSQLVLKRELYNFFNALIKSVEISTKTKNEMGDSEVALYKNFFDTKPMEILYEKININIRIEKTGVEKIIFMIHPDGLFLRKTDITKFIEKSPFEDFNTKLNYLVKYYESFLDIIAMRKTLWRAKSKVLDSFYYFNYHYAGIYSVIMSVFTCLFMLFSLTIQYDYFENSGRLRVLRTKMEVGEGDGGVIENYTGMNKPIQYSDPSDFITHKIALFHLITIGLIIFNWLCFSIYKLQKFVHIRLELTKFEIIKNYLSIIIDWEIMPLTWNFFWGFLAYSFSKLYFLFSLQLFMIIFFIPTMTSVVSAIRIRYKQFASSGLLIAILILFYSAVSFYFFQDEFYKEEIQVIIISIITLYTFYYIIYILLGKLLRFLFTLLPHNS